MRTSLIDYLNEVASRQTDTAFVHRPRLRRHEWTNGDISQLANQFTRELESRQIGHGDRVVVWAENSPEWVAAFFGIISRGAIAVPLDEQSAPDFVRRVCDKTEPKLLLYSSDVDRSSLNIPSIGLNGLPNEVARHPAEPIAFHCPACLWLLYAPVALAGRDIRCPACERRAEVPRPTGQAARPCSPTESSAGWGLPSLRRPA